MTLRARLTATFLAVVLGPVLLGAIFVGTTVTALSHDRARERLAGAAAAVRAEIGARCQRLTVAAASAALLAAADSPTTPAVDNGLAATVTLVDAHGNITATSGPPAPAAWADCAGTDLAAPAAFGVRVERRDPAGQLLGYAVATAPVDDALVQGLARAGAASVTMVSSMDSPLSTESSAEARRVSRAAGTARSGRIATTGAGRYIHRLDPESGQPLRLALAIDPPPAGGLYTVLVLVVAVAGLVAVAAAWWLARTTTRPLTDLADAAERVAAGDLAAKVPVRSTDEVGQLGATFNRMTRQMGAYVRALTASRDQLRGYLALLGDTLSGTHDLSRILHITLHTARAATSAQSGVVLLYDPTSRMLVAQCAVGPRELTGLRLKVGEGLLGAVAECGVPARGRVTGDTPLAPQEPRPTTYVAVPFAAPAVDSGAEAARGVLALYDRVGPDGFDEADVATLTTFAGQAAVALDNVRLHEEAQRLSLTDPLTGLFNYRYLRESLRRELERAARFGRTLAVLALDLDHFKEVNDTYGHGAGDLVLAELARRIRAVTREVDFAFRRGGEEFVILLPETDAAGGAALARRLGAAVRGTPVHAADHAITVTVSIGVAVYPDHGATGTALLDTADIALYAAKAAGRDACRIAAAGGPAGGADGGVDGGVDGAVPQPKLLVPGASWGTQPARRVRGG